MAVFLHSEDDLAALLAHEMGHALAHQSAVTFSQGARGQLGVKSFPDPKSVLEAYGRLLERFSADRKSARAWVKRQAKRNEPLQEGADRTALYLLASAGYPPRAMENLFNRLAQTHGQTGNWLTDLFRITTPHEKRLRALKLSLAQMPAACKTRKPSPLGGEFAAWRASLILFDSVAEPAQATPTPTGILHPGLAGDIGRIRFSPNGRYLLAQDPSGILVYSTSPLRLLFRIDARDADYSNFSPDSQSLVIYTNGLRVEKWNLASRRRVSLRMAVPLTRCWAEADSPDGRFLVVMACDGNLSVMDEDTGKTIFSKGRGGEWRTGAFSPDGRYFVATKWIKYQPFIKAVAVDLENHREVSMPPALQNVLGMSRAMVFLGSSRLAVETMTGEDVAFLNALRDTFSFAGEWVSTGTGGVRILVQGFPEGKFLGGLDLSHREKLAANKSPKPPRHAPNAGQTSMPDRMWRATGEKDEILLSPLQGYPAALLDLSRRLVMAKFPSSAVDVFGTTFAIQHEGWLRLDDLKKRSILASAELPTARLGSLTVAEVSPDLKWLAISDNHEGAVYSLVDGRLIDETPEFTSGWFGAANALYADFPEPLGSRKAGGSTIKRTNLETSAPPFNRKLSRSESQYGAFLVNFHSDATRRKSSQGSILKVRNLTDKKLLWTRKLPEMPAIFLQADGRTFLFLWFLPSKTKEPGYKKLGKMFGAGHKSGYAFQVIDAETGAVRGNFFLAETLLLQKAFAAGGRLLVTDSSDLTFAYSLSSSHPEGITLGRAGALSPDADLACIVTAPRSLQIDRMPSLDPIAARKFASPISLVRFSHDGRRLFVLTSDQRFFIFPVSGSGAGPEKSSASSTPAPGWQKRDGSLR